MAIAFEGRCQPILRRLSFPAAEALAFWHNVLTGSDESGDADA
jgi:hypothetical protein